MEDDSILPKPSAAKIISRHEQEKVEFRNRVARIKSSIPKKNRSGRARAAENAAEEEGILLAAHARELLENGITDEDVAQILGANPNFDSLQPIGKSSSEGIEKNESKAVRRRRKKAEQEAETQRRIDEEKANMGPSPRYTEMQAIDSQLKPKNMCIHQVAADGNCLYSAVAHQMKTLGIESVVPASVEGLRNATADYLMAHKSDYMPFIEDVNGDEERFKTYCDELRCQAVWGGQVELKAMAEILNVSIDVYASDLPVVKMGSTSAESRALRVSFHRQYFGLGEHYNSIIATL